MNKGTVLKMNHEMNIEMNGKMNVEMNHRMTLSTETIIRLKNRLNFTNFTSSLWTGNRKYWIEGAFYHNKDSILKFKINCESKIHAMETLQKIRRA